MQRPVPSLSDEDFEHILRMGEEMAARAGTDEPGPKFSSEPSCLPRTSKADMPSTRILTVDVGGTHTKVGVREADASARIRWIKLLDVYNHHLDLGDSSDTALVRMVHTLASLIDSRLRERSIDRESVRGVGVVWSNKVRNRELDPDVDGISGVTGTVTGVRDGMSYRKGEWFNADLRDGDDIGQMIYTAFRDLGFPIEAFVIGNDTVFTFKATEGADAGIVASTGANGTIVPRRGQMAGRLCNAESGGGFSIPREMVSPPDVLNGAQVKLEDLLAGMGIAPRYSQYVQSLAAHDAAFEPCAEENGFANESISLLLNRNYESLRERRASARSWGRKTLAALTELAEQLIERAGRLAAALVYFSISNQLDEKDEFVISLDSSQARYNLPYRMAMERTLGAILERRSKRARIELIVPRDNISVPQMGAGRAVNDFLA